MDGIPAINMVESAQKDAVTYSGAYRVVTALVDSLNAAESAGAGPAPHDTIITAFPGYEIRYGSGPRRTYWYYIDLSKPLPDWFARVIRPGARQPECSAWSTAL